MENNSALPDQSSTQSDAENTVPIAIQILIWLFYALSTVYALKSRSLDDFLKYGSYISISFLTIVLLVFIIYLIRTGIKDNLEWRIVLILLLITPFAIIIGAVTFYSVFVFLKDIVLWIFSPTLSKASAAVFTVLFTSTVGAGLFYFRLKTRVIYGFTEATIGLAVSIQRVWDQPDQIKTFTFYFALLTASIYLFVRGLDNIHQGLTKEPVDPWGYKIYAFLKKRT